MENVSERRDTEVTRWGGRSEGSLNIFTLFAFCILHVKSKELIQSREALFEISGKLIFAEDVVSFAYVRIKTFQIHRKQTLG